MLTYRSGAERTRTSSIRGLSILSAPTPMPAFAARPKSAHIASTHLTQLAMTAGWRPSAMHVQATGTATTVAVKQVQGGRISGCDVTVNAFSTRMGSPSCSPPV